MGSTELAHSTDLDLLYGVAAIAAALDMDVKACRHRIDGKQIPTFRLGGTVCARRSSLATWLDEIEAAARFENEGGAPSREADDGR